jgi:integrase
VKLRRRVFVHSGAKTIASRFLPRPAQKTGVSVFTVLPDFVTRALDAIPRVKSTQLFWRSTGKVEGLRDTFATELLLGGVPIERVAILLGHQSVKVTEKYYSAWTDSRQRQIEADLQRAWDRDPIVLRRDEGYT